MVIQVLFAFQMRCGMNELEHCILSLPKQQRKRPERDSAMPVYFVFLAKKYFLWRIVFAYLEPFKPRFAANCTDL